MQFLIDKAKALSIGWNDSSIDIAGVYRICKRFRITAQEMPLMTDGFYYRVMGRDYIAIDSKLAEPEKLFVLAHELAHFLFHTPETGATANFHGVGRRTRKEREADVFAICLVIPRPVIEGRVPQDLIDEGMPTHMVEARFETLFRYGI
ncbi:MAG: ImmA/IrrE family metallo-endopeptidase [Pyrinomonadaceae bacterium]